MVSANPVPRAGLLGTQRSVCVRGVAEPRPSSPGSLCGLLWAVSVKAGTGEGSFRGGEGRVRSLPPACRRPCLAQPRSCPARAGALLQQAGAPALQTHTSRGLLARLVAPAQHQGPPLSSASQGHAVLTRSFSLLDVACSETPTDAHTRCPSWKVEKRLPSSVDPVPPLRCAPVLLWPIEALGSDGLF